MAFVLQEGGIFFGLQPCGLFELNSEIPLFERRFFGGPFLDQNSLLNVSKSQKQIFLFSILPKNERKFSILVYQAIKIEDFRLFFGKLENKIHNLHYQFSDL